MSEQTEEPQAPAAPPAPKGGWKDIHHLLEEESRKEINQDAIRKIRGEHSESEDVEGLSGQSASPQYLSKGGEKHTKGHNVWEAQNAEYTGKSAPGVTPRPATIVPRKSK